MLSYSAGLNSMFDYIFMEEIIECQKMRKNSEIQRKPEHKLPFLQIYETALKTFFHSTVDIGAL